MSKSRKWIAACLAVAVIALGIQLATAFFGHNPLNIPILICTGILPVGLLVGLLSRKDK